MTKKKKTFDKFYIGFILGLIFPLIAVYFFYVFQNFNLTLTLTFEGFIKKIFEYNVATKVISVCLTANLAIFYLFIHTKKYFSAKGVVGVTILYAITTAIYMFI